MTTWREHRTTRWRGVLAISLAALTVGLLSDRPDVLLLAVVGVVFGAYPQVTGAPEPSVRIERRLDDVTPRRGGEVAVTVTISNDGDRSLFDLRVVDGVPPALSVSDGSPRHATAIRAGSSRSFTYTVTAERGKHRFEPATVVARDLSGEHEAEATVAAETEIDCTASTTSAPMRRQTLPAVGRVTSDRGGSGVEFHRTREYQRGDAISRIDWKRYARTGDPTTIEFRREQAASVVLLVDARAAAYRSRPGEPHAVAFGVSAARQLAETLVQQHNRVGAAAIGRSLAWVPPGAGEAHADDVEALFATHEAFASTPPSEPADHAGQLERLRDRLPDGSQVILFSPLTDDDVVAVARRLDVEDHRVSVVSPTVTATDSPARRLAGAERRRRIGALRNADVPVIRWDPERPLAAAIDENAGRWIA